MRLYKGILLIQGTYTALTALWALVHIDSFMKITGPKTDIWLVKTVAVILLAIGLTFLTHAFQPKINLTAIVLALSTSLGLAIIDFYLCFTRNHLIYLLFMELMAFYRWVSSLYGSI